MSCIKHILALVFLYPLVLFAQSTPERINNYIEKIIEQTISSSAGEANVESIVSDLEFLLLNPINLNATNAQELDKLWILNDFQIQALLDYRKKMQQIVSIYELNYVFGLNEKTVELISPFVYIGSSDRKKSASFSDISNSLNHEVLLRASQQSITNKNYSGSNQKYYARYKAWYKNQISIGFIAEKDAGEEFFRGSNPNGFDYYSGFIQYNGQNSLKTIVLGDYRVRAGQGLLIWPGYSSGKSSQVTSIQKRGQGISGNTSADEYGFFRGSAVTIGKKNFTVSLFGSYKQIDTSYDTALGGILTIRKDGLHRTNTEKSYKNNSSEQLFGAKINYKSKKVHLGFNYLNLAFSNPILPSNKTYQYYNFTGQEYNGISTDYKILLQRLQLFGEVAYANNGLATLNGINLMPHPQFLASLVYRNYQSSYFSPYSNALAESSTAANEEGLYAGVKWNTDWKITVSAYADVFSFPWAKYGIDGPSNGKEYLLETVYNPKHEIEITLRYKYQEKIKNFTANDESQLNNLVYYNQNSLRLNLWYLLSDKVSMSNRFEWAQSGYTRKGTNHGHLLYQDILYKPTNKIQINFRYTWFDINEFNSRIYAYESNARYVYSMPAYNGKGTKTYFVFRYKVSNWLMLWLRYSYINYLKKEETKPEKHEGLIQLILTF